MSVVADASAVGAYLLPDEQGPEAELAQSVCETQVIHAPQHWSVEVANLIWAAQRRGRVDAAQMRRLLRAGTGLIDAATMHAESPLEVLVTTATERKLTTYDASYLLLASRLGVPLLTFDHRLGAAAEAHGVTVLRP